MIDACKLLGLDRHGQSTMSRFRRNHAILKRMTKRNGAPYRYRRMLEHPYDTSATGQVLLRSLANLQRMRQMGDLI